MLTKFKEILNRNDQINFLKSLIIIAHADGVVDKNENVIIDQYMGVLNLNEFEKKEISESLENPPLIEEVINQFIDNRAKLLLLMEAYNIAYIDNDFSFFEKKTIDKIIKNLNIPIEKAKEIEKWVKKKVKLRKQGLEIIGLKE